MKNAFQIDGYLKFNLLNSSEFHVLKAFTFNWIYSLLNINNSVFTTKELLISNYHNWPCEILKDHDQIFTAKNRHCLPSEEINKLINNINLDTALREAGCQPRTVFWDEGLGWLGLRLIRPRSSDGYPLSKKIWGPAKNVVSVYVPIVGFEPEQTIGLVKGSHLKEYPSYLPANSKFCKDELRVDLTNDTVVITRPSLREGEAIIFGPNTLHTEEIKGGAITRLSLEFRVPLSPKNDDAL